MFRGGEYHCSTLSSRGLTTGSRKNIRIKSTINYFTRSRGQATG
ncbi:palindromic element RPE4 domain-containing protein [Rickettsia sp.]